MLDVNGEVRIRILPDASTGAYNLVLADNDGNISSTPIPGLSANIVGDIKKGFQVADHAGWYLMDGRALNTFSTGVQSAAAGIGITSNLPDARGRFLKTKTGSEILGSTSGSNDRILLQSNFPSGHSFSGTTSVNGAHSHTGQDTVASGSPDGIQYMASNMNPVYSFGNTVNKETSVSGTHAHASVTVSSEGGGTSFSIVPQNTTVNTFIYLGN
ncbi:hypothetical protein ACFOEQ_06035 [Chryseobacterium arachidis]